MREAGLSRKLRVLVADDEKIIADSLQLILAGVGYDVRVVYDGLSAVQESSQWPPDLFLSDVLMPGFTGIDAAIEVRKRLPDCRVLLVTGQSDLNQLQREIVSKGETFELFSKPIHPTELIAQIRRIL